MLKACCHRHSPPNQTQLQWAHPDMPSPRAARRSHADPSERPGRPLGFGTRASSPAGRAAERRRRARLQPRPDAADRPRRGGGASAGSDPDLRAPSLGLDPRDPGRPSRAGTPGRPATLGRRTHCLTRVSKRPQDGRPRQGNPAPWRPLHARNARNREISAKVCVNCRHFRRPPRRHWSTRATPRRHDPRPIRIPE